MKKKVESKQDELSSSKRELEEEKELLQRGKREAATEADNLNRRREVINDVTSSQWAPLTCGRSMLLPAAASARPFFVSSAHHVGKKQARRRSPTRLDPLY